MKLQKIIKKFTTSFPFRKNVILTGAIGLVGIFALVFFVSAADIHLSASVLGLNKVGTSKHIGTKKDVKIVVSTGDSCFDSDGGTNHAVKGTITTIIDGYTRVEEDTCNTNGTLKEWFCGNPGDSAGFLRSENYVNCGSEHFCYQGACTNCDAPENILACNLGLAACPPQCMGQIFTGGTGGIGDIIIESMSIQNDPATVGSNTVNNKVYVTLKNIGNGNIIIPVANGANRFGFGCRSNEGSLGVSSNGLGQTVLGPNESISTELVGQQYNMLWYGSIGSKSMNCSVESQQQQNWNNPDPSDTSIIFEADGTNNSFTLNYEVVAGTGNK